ncbi:hypothetical protein DKT69_34385 [Micromonospora sicca]|uniref:Glycosyltransferase subfamily 4-like N-terminal domain-containing protein n=1 Tax=Micromonospora sicca TaxID=2202420 RepID=A0A317D502_9ACTN|nr:glycosyltransferase family 4 protein [Micromonospora sp. 4G51]PWR07635.1 hypothetical protein DKT69_34385 [Micromonospora sp. 4G51]
MIPPNRPRGHALRVLRLCSTFEMPSGRPDPRAARFDAIGGMQTHTGELSRALDALGVAQRVVTAWRPGAPRVDRFGRAAVVLRLGVPTRRLRQCYALPAAHVLNRLAARADLVHAHLGEDLAVVPLALAVVRRHGLPLVLTVHTSPRHTMAVTGPRSAYLHALGGWWERLGERRADQVIALTPRLARVLTADGVPAARLSVVPSGIREELFAGPPVADPLAGLPRPRVVFLGRLHPQKNVPLLLAAMARLPAPGAHLTRTVAVDLSASFWPLFAGRTSVAMVAGVVERRPVIQVDEARASCCR